jgi:hypothetical protein
MKQMSTENSKEIVKPEEVIFDSQHGTAEKETRHDSA